MFMNAIQAMGDNGSLSVKTFLQSTGNGRQDAAGKTVVVQIEDTGSGIAADKLDKLFEPFFTTKPVGSGTGLGLSVSRKILLNCTGGALASPIGQALTGVAVTIVFPVPNRS